MNAIVVESLGSPENLKYRDVEMPVMGPKQVLIRVKTTSVNFADIKARRGNKGQGAVPFIPGLEAAGVIEQVGADVTSLHKGQRVIAFPHNGSYAEYIVADENLTFAIPNGIGFDIAGACGIVSFLSYSLLVELARIQEGETVLIHAASGGVGTTAIQIAKIFGAGLVVGTVGSEAKKAAAVRVGADHVFCYEEEGFAENVNEITNGKGVNIILDSVGGEVTEQSMKCLARYGRLVIFGNSSGKYGQLETSDLHASCRSVLGFSLGTTRKERPEQLKRIAEKVLRLLENRRLQIEIGATFPLKDASLAHNWVESRKSTGKVLLKVENE